jgi:hypothetical protein
MDDVGMRYTIIDTTAAPPVVAALSANEADIAASVLSSEKASCLP